MSDTDMRMLQTLFDQSPPAPHVVNAGRDRLQHSYRRSAFRMPRFSLPTMAGLGAASLGAAAAGVAAVMAFSGSPAVSHNPAALPAGPRSAQLTAGQVLLTAAHTVASMPSTLPQPQQWLRVASVETGAGSSTASNVNWTTFNGVRSAYYQAGKLIVHTSPSASVGGVSTPMGAYDALTKLPASPQALLKGLSVASAGQGFSTSTNPEVRTWSNIVQLLWDSEVAAPPARQAEIFTALTKLPGLRVERVTDAFGKPALGLYLPAAGHSDLLLDPGTYQVIGRLTISTGSYSKAEQEMAKFKGLKLPKAGTVTWSIARTTTRVGGPGQG